MTQPLVLGRGEDAGGVAGRLAVVYEPIARDLASVEQLWARVLRSRFGFVDTLLERVSSYGGKRLRPALLLLSAKATGGVCEAHIVLAAVIGMIHTATLVHDDVLDDALLRRHRATVNATWGTKASVLLGDYLFTHAFHLSASLDSTLACRLIGQATNIVCEGELHQIQQRGNLDLDEQQYFQIIRDKTAELCAVSCQLGAHYAGAAQERETALRSYGHDLGMAFQICDDLLDLSGDELSTGKSLGTDVEQQKLTLPLIWLLREGPERAVRAVRGILSGYGNHKREQLRVILAQYHALDYAKERAHGFAASARDRLSSLSASPAKEVLLYLTEFVVDRSA